MSIISSTVRSSFIVMCSFRILSFQIRITGVPLNSSGCRSFRGLTSTPRRPPHLLPEESAAQVSVMELLHRDLEIDLLERILDHHRMLSSIRLETLIIKP
jgi:hypothetical protein